MFKIKEKYNNKEEWSFAFKVMNPHECYATTNYNYLYVAAFKWSYWLYVPMWFKPHKKWIDCSKYKWSTSPYEGYTNYIPRVYGFSVDRTALHLYYGIQPGSWSSKDPKNSDHSKCFFLPWNESRRIHIDYMNPDGTLFERYYDNKNGSINFEWMEKIRENIPKVKFSFKDFDGEENVATCYLETSMYRRGSSWCKFLGYAIPPKFYRNMEIQFDKETGREKGSWKGGITGTSIEYIPGETMLETFKRYGRSEVREKGYRLVNREFSEIKQL